MPRIPLARPYWDKECEMAAINALSSKRWVKGPEAKAFGQEFAKWCGAIAAVPCQSGSAALTVALRLLEIGPGDEVIVPGMTFIATATSVSLVGATPVFADIEEDYWCISPKDVEAKITSKTKAIIGVHIFGQPFSPKLREICDKENIVLIEDAAHAVGVTWKGKYAGTFGLAGIYSLQSYKVINAGEGGVLVTNDADIFWKSVFMSGAYESNYSLHSPQELSIASAIVSQTRSLRL